MSVPIDTCLQCDQTRATVKANDYYCATVDYYGECQEEWPRHRWADWTDTAPAHLAKHYEGHRAHVAEVLDKHMQEREARAWSAGFHKGRKTENGSHISTWPKNPYRKDTSNGR